MILDVPTYIEKGKTYYSDTCLPVVQAVEAGKIHLETLTHGVYPGRKLDDSQLQGVLSLGYWNSTSVQDWGLDWHRNEGIEFTCLANGELPFALESGEYILQPDDLTITRPWQLHKVGNPTIGINRLYVFILDVGIRKPHQQWTWPSWIVLTKKDIGELTRILRQNEENVWKASPDLRECFIKIGQAVRNSRYTDTISKLTIYLNEFLLLLLEMLKKCEPSLNISLTTIQRSVKMFLHDLKDSLAERWTVHSMAEECGLGVTSFAHYCKQITNMTPMQLLMYKRIEAAEKMLLEKTDLSILNIALDCGFSTSQYFASCFRKYTGITPSEYRNKITSGKSGGDLSFSVHTAGC